jgi:hypothetical protein
MLEVWTFIKGAFAFLVKNWGWVVTVIAALFIFLFFKQCSATKDAKAETVEAKLIADNNLKALKDSTIVLEVTKGQLSLIDNNLYNVVQELDNLKKHPQTVVVVKPQYIPKLVVVDDSLIRDSKDSTKYGLRFKSVDSVRTIGAVSWFNVYDNFNKLQLKGGKTDIDNFALNFGIIVDKYDDKANKMTRLSILPCFVDDAGNFGKPISKEMLNLKFRGADLLDVPYVDNTQPVVLPKHKYSLRSGFSFNVNLLSYGYTPFTSAPALNWMMPSLGIGYSFVLIRNK